MKTPFIVILLMIYTTSATGQIVNDYQYITVTGSAEISVPPDEIVLQVVLKEFDINGKKIGLEVIENKFFSILKSHNILKSEVLISQQGNYWYHWWQCCRDAIYRQKIIDLKLMEPKNMLELIGDLNFTGVFSLKITRTSNRALQDLRKKVKIQAMQAAKEKATYLLESIGEQVGSVLFVEEAPTNDFHYRNLNQISNVMLSSPQNSKSIANIDDIKVRYEIKARFQIKP